MSSAVTSPALQSLDGGAVDAVPHATYERLQRNYDRVSAELRVAEEREAGLRREAEELHAALDAALRQDDAARLKRVDRSVQTVATPSLLPQQLGVQREQSSSGPTFNTPDSQTYRFPRFRHSVVSSAQQGDEQDPASQLVSPRPHQSAVPAIAIGHGLTQSARTPPAGGGSSARATKFDAALMSQQLRTVGAGFGGGAALGVDAGHAAEPTPRFTVPSLPSGSFRGVRSTPDGVVVVVPTPRRTDSATGSVGAAAVAVGGDTARRGRRRGNNPDADSDGGHTLDTSIEPPLRIAGGGEDDERWREAEERLHRRAELLANLRVGPADLHDECGLCHVTHTVMALAEDDDVSAVLSSAVPGGGCTTVEWLVDAFVHYADMNERWMTRDEDLVLRATISALDADERGGSLLWHDAAPASPPKPHGGGEQKKDDDANDTVVVVDEDDEDAEEERLEARSERIDTVQLIVPEGPELSKRFTLEPAADGGNGTATSAATPMGGTPQISRQQHPAGESLSVPRLHIGSGMSGAAANPGASAPLPHRVPPSVATPVRGAAAPPTTVKGVPVSCDVFQTPDALLVFVETAEQPGGGAGRPALGTGRRVRAVCSPRCCGIHCGRQAGGGKFTLQGPPDEGPKAAVVWTADGPFPFSNLTFTAPTTTVAKFRRQLAALRQCCPHHATGVFRDGWHVIGHLVSDHLRAALDAARSPMMTDR